MQFHAAKLQKLFYLCKKKMQIVGRRQQKKRRGDAFFGLGRDVIRADLRRHRR